MFMALTWPAPVPAPAVSSAGCVPGGGGEEGGEKKGEEGRSRAARVYTSYSLAKRLFLLF